MPTGLKNSPINSEPVSHIGPRAAICDTYQVVFTVANQPIQALPVIVPLGCSVAIRGVTLQGVNQGVVAVSNNPAGLYSSAARIITPDTEISFPVDRLSQIWAMGANVGDGLVITVSGAALA
jgi:hypothetical protein